jgi:hypothetical protein
MKLNRANNLHWRAVLIAVTFIFSGILPAIAQPSIPENPPANSITSNRPIDEDEVRQAIKEMEDSSERQDVDGVMKFIAPFAHSEITSQTDTRSSTEYVEGLTQHRTVIAESIKRGKSQQRKMLRQRIRVQITADGTAALATLQTSTGFVSLDPKPKRYIALTEQTLRFGKINSKLMLTSSKSSTRVTLRPNEPQK